MNTMKNQPTDLLDTLDLFFVMSKNQEWWIGLARELQKDIELEK